MMANVLELSVTANCPLWHMCHGYATTDRECFIKLDSSFCELLWQGWLLVFPGVTGRVWGLASRGER